jgi:hypothetical protein
MKRSLSVILAICLLCPAPAVFAFKLISDDEGRLPAASGGLVTRGITRGPTIKMLSPDLAAGPVKGPFNLKLAFEPRGGAKIDPASIRLTYLKAQPVELTERVKPAVTASGIELADAEAPPGEHPLQVTVADSEGRVTTTVFRLNIAH